ncbi:MAG: GntR family transcriptional regulator [Clostridia bacterium]|nr:GntR family transcriptional regulator [Clostridia bacterium]
MQRNLDKTKPLCPQICEHICLDVALGELKPNERIKSVREAAVAVGVNPNTMQRSYEILEQEGILYSVRGTGWFVSENTEKAKQSLEKLKEEKTRMFFEEMLNLGMSAEELREFIKEYKYD